MPILNFQSPIKVFLLENIHPNAQSVLEKEGYEVELLAGSLNEDELCEKIKDVSIIGIRSKTHITPRVLEAAEQLIAVGAFCIGTNQIDLEGCLLRGIPVFNAPFSNTRSVVELAIAELILLMRKVPERNRKMHAGIWDKSATGSHEVRGKKLGIVGYGNIGVQLSVIAENLGMDVYYYDVVEKLALSNATKCETLEELLGTVDAVTLHVDGRDENKYFFGRKHFEMMKEGSVFLNLARGFVVDVEALSDHIRSGHIKGAGVDVFPKEPKTNHDPFESELMGLPNLILTPHIGGSTQEAQLHISNYVPTKIKDYINTGSTYGSVNFPNLQLSPFENAHRLIHIHRNQPGVMAKMNRIFGDFDINILGQYLRTNESIGYVITDVDRDYDDAVVQALKAIDGTIRFRILY